VCLEERTYIYVCLEVFGLSRKSLYVYMYMYTATHCNTLQHTATSCNTLQHTATHCNTLLSNDYTCMYLDTYKKSYEHRIDIVYIYRIIYIYIYISIYFSRIVFGSSRKSLYMCIYRQIYRVVYIPCTYTYKIVYIYIYIYIYIYVSTIIFGFSRKSLYMYIHHCNTLLKNDYICIYVDTYI